jgi:hypothetical protein
MYAYLMFMASFTACPATEIINKTFIPINQFDMRQLSRAQLRCRQLYKKSPCLKIFTKIGEQDYTAICGKTRSAEVAIRSVSPDDIDASVPLY